MNRMNDNESRTYCVRYNSNDYVICMYNWDKSPFDTSKIITKRSANGCYDYKIIIEITDSVKVNCLICNSQNYLEDITINQVKPTMINGVSIYSGLNVSVRNAEMLLARDRNELSMYSNVLYPFYYNSVIYVSIDDEGLHLRDYSDIIKNLARLLSHGFSIIKLEEFIENNPDELFWEKICPIEDVISYWDNLLK